MDAWRGCVSDKPIFGDKGDMYQQHFGATCAEVFPGCKFVLTVRHPLDTLSSYIAQPWAAYMRADGNRDAFRENIRSRVREMLTANAAWRERAEVIEFEQLRTEDGFLSTFVRVFLHLGADPRRYNWKTGWAACRHQTAFGRWERDPEIGDFMSWLAQRDPPLHELLASGAYYADGGLASRSVSPRK
jgi:hypothetical protein